MMYFSNFKKAVVLLICAVGIFFSVPNLMGEQRVDALPSWWQPVNLGLDLQGGSHLLLEVDVDTVVTERLSSVLDSVRQTLRKEKIRYTDLSIVKNNVTVIIKDEAKRAKARKLLKNLDPEMTFSAESGAFLLGFDEEGLIKLRLSTVDQSIEIVRRRIDELGTREPAIQRQGDDRILVQLPGVDNPERVKELIGKTAKMTFHLVDHRTSVYDAKRGKLPPSSKLMQGVEGASSAWFVVKRRVEVGGEHLVDSQPTFQDGMPVVSFRFDALGGRRFGKVTKSNVNKQLAIVLDGKVISAPNINGAILGGSGVITGSFSAQEASDLSLLLRAGALPAPLNVLEERTIGPGLGHDSIRAGGIASALGLALVVVFMLIAYGLFGIFANIALLVNMSMLIGVLSMLGATLTLPGIAGIVLTMGMAVDANVLVFERIREEVKLGRSALNAAGAGFKFAFKTILDANVTSLVAAIVLFQFGSGPVRGFAVTLGIGILTSMFTTIMLTRLIVISWFHYSKPKTLPI
ncbi:MAG: protein translocase subunit SecD [Alphaproteobacteria bacterium]|nr:protein translocase subunit SecD [Alphaproteobacteria bacterium]